MLSTISDGLRHPAQALASLNTELLKFGRYSDLRVKRHGKLFNVHRSVVCLQPLSAAVDGELKEGKTGVIHLRDVDPDTIEN